ncbi:MAG: VWA domain-containing protein [Anaerolineae bacterium]
MLTASQHGRTSRVTFFALVLIFAAAVAAAVAAVPTASGRQLDEPTRLKGHGNFSMEIDPTLLDAPTIKLGSGTTALSDVLLSEDFEGTWPVSPWQVFDNDDLTHGEYYWADRCYGKDRTTGAWAIGGGATGSLLSCGSQYPNNLVSVALAGPFDFTDVTRAMVELDLYVDTECVGVNCSDKRDELRVVSFTDPSDMDGNLWAGDWPSDPSADQYGWVSDSYEFTKWNGEPEVWIGLVFVSDSTVTTRHGAYVDNVVLSVERETPTATIDTLTTDRQCYTPGSTISVFTHIGTSLPSQAVTLEGQLAQYDVVWAWKQQSGTAPGDFVLTVDVPADVPVGDHVIRLLVHDATSGRYQGYREVPVLIDPVCGTVTAPVTSTATPTPTGTPEAVATLCPGETFEETKHIHVAPAPGRADILFAFDTTGSMQPVLDSAQANAVTIMSNLAALIPDVQFGVVDLRDYPLETFGESGDWPYQLRQRITANRAAVEAAINATVANGGNDSNEAYTRALYESYADPRVGWRTHARRFVVMFGDDVSHDNNLNERIVNPPINPGRTWCGGTSLGCVLDPGRDGVSGTSDDLDLQSTLDSMRANQTTLLYVVSGGPGSASQANLVTYWGQWASWTGAGGAAVPLTDAANLPSVIQNLVSSAGSHISRLELVADPPQYQSWLTVSPPAYTDLSIPPTGLDLTFDVDITVPLGTPPGTVHQFAVRAIGDGAVYGSQGVTINVPAWCATPTVTPTHRTPTITPLPPETCPPVRPEVTPSCTDLDYVRNGDFEKASRSWGGYSTAGRDIVTTSAIQGFFSAQFVGQASAITDEQLYQFYDIPPELDGLSFSVDNFVRVLNSVGTPAVRSGDFFIASLYDVELMDEVVRLWEFDPTLPTDCAVDSPTYNLTPAQLNAVRGRTVALVLHLHKQSRGWQPSVLLDGLHLWVCSSGPPCRIEGNKWADPDVVPSGGETTVFLSLTGLDGSCVPSRRPADVMLVIDNSGSMDNDGKLTNAQAAAKGFIDRLDLDTDRVGLVSFSTSAVRRSGLTQDAGPIRNAIDALRPGSETNIADGIRTAQAELATNGTPGNQPVMILLSDGNPNVEADQTEPEANAAKAAGTRVFTIGLGSDVDPDLMTRLASSPADYFFAPDAGKLDAIYQQIAGVIGGSPATNIVIVDRLSDYVTLVPNSFTGTPLPEVSPDGKTLTWRIPRLGIETLVWSYRVRMTRTPGTWPTNESAVATFTNSQGDPGSLTYPIPQVTVLAPENRHPDAMCRDHPTDDGSVPSNGAGEPWWDSPDIWVRHSRDGVAAHQNPIAGQTNYLYVRVRNRGDADLTGITVHAYDAPGAANIRWPVDWVPEIGSANIAALAAGQTAVVAIPWLPARDGHMCFLIRIEAEDDPIKFDGHVPFDNNLCQRNLQVVDGGAGGSTTSTVGGGSRGRVKEHGTWSLNVKNWPSSSRGSMKFEDEDLFDRWQRNGGATTGEINDENKSVDFGGRIVSSAQQADTEFEVVIDRIPYEGEEVSQFTITVTGDPDAEPPYIELIQLVDGVAVGGNVIRPAVDRPVDLFLPYLGSGHVLGGRAESVPGPVSINGEPIRF